MSTTNQLRITVLVRKRYYSTSDAGIRHVIIAGDSSGFMCNDDANEVATYTAPYEC